MNAISVHVFHAGRWRDHRGRRICQDCGSTEDATVHRVPERSDDERQHESRRVGERGDQAD